MTITLAAQFAFPAGMLGHLAVASAQVPTTAPAATPDAPATAPAVTPPVAAAPDSGTNPATAPAVAPAVVTPAPAPAPMPPAPAAAPVVTSSGAPEDQAAASALNAEIKFKTIKKQQSAYAAMKLVEKARTEQAANQWQDALANYRAAIALDPDNAQARAGGSEVEALLGMGAPTPAVTQNNEIQIEIQQINASFNAALQKADDDTKSQKWADAEKDIEEARVASRHNPTLFTQPQINDFETRVNIAEQNLTIARQKADLKANDAQVNAAVQSQEERERKFQQDRQNTITGLIQDAQQYANKGQWKQALDVVYHIKQIDPTNVYANGVEQIFIDKANLAEQRQYREEFDTNYTSVLNMSQEEKIPYKDIVTYSPDWPQISEMRDKEVAADRGDDQEDAQLNALLNRRLPEVRFNANSLSDVIDFLRDLTGANIYVDWKALEAASIARDAQVTVRLRDIKFSKALELIFKSVEGDSDDQKLGYSLDDGVITISTRKELNKNTITRRYDINDLLFVAPDYNNAPDLSLETAGQGQTAGGGTGGGGGGQQQNLFQTNNQQNPQQQTGQREARIDEIKQYITQNVDTNSWKDNGGDVGSISSSPLRAVLLITQTADNQHKITSVLDSLRASQALLVSVETRFLVVQRNYLEDIGVNANFEFNPLQQPGNSRSGYNSSRFSPISVLQSAVTNNTTFTDANGNTVQNSQQGSRQLDWVSNVGNAAVPGSIAADPADYPNPIIIQGSYVDNMTVNFLIRAVEANVSTVNLTAPRLTLFSGQRALLVVETQQAYVSGLTPVVAPGAALFDPQVSTVTATGVVLSVLATVSPDRKYVFMDIQPQLARLRALVPFTISAIVQTNTTALGGTSNQIIQGTLQLPTIDLTIVRTSASVPDGATLMLGGQTLAAETTREQGVPVLSKIPFLKRLFTNRATSQDEQILLILVKPTIIIQQEQENKAFPSLAARPAAS